MSLASYFDLARAVLTPPRSTSRSKPTRSRTLSTILRTALAMSQPITRIATKASAFGRKSMTARSASPRAPVSLSPIVDLLQRSLSLVAVAYPITAGPTPVPDQVPGNSTQRGEPVTRIGADGTQPGGAEDRKSVV